MIFSEYIANSNVAFGGGEFKAALNYAESAIKDSPDRPDGYYCAGKACMSMGDLDDAISYFTKALSLNKTDGNGYFFLGYAQAMANQTANALRSLTRAIENNCSEGLKGQIYKMMAMINADQGDYQNALVNLEQAEISIGLDYEILQQKAACYASFKDYHQTIFILNQMKLLRPRDYIAYNLAFSIFMELEIYDEALGELERAEKYADLVISYYNDRIAYILLHSSSSDTEESIQERWKQALKTIDEGLTKGKPTAEQVFEFYLRAAQLYLSLEMPEIAIRILDSAINPVSSYNSGFSILLDEVNEESFLNSADVKIDPEYEEALMQEKWDYGEFDDIREEVNEALLENVGEDSAEIAEEVHKYLSPTDVIPDDASTEAEKYIITEEFKMEQLQYDLRNSMYIAAYELMQDYDSMLKKARELQSSSILANQYSGIYYELKVGKYTNKDNWQKKYRERINYWTKCMLKDPMDYISASYRIRSYIDIEDFENAEQLCACLPAEVKEPLMEEIHKAKVDGGGEVGNIS